MTITFSDVQEDSGPEEKRMRLRSAGTCLVCSTALPAKAEAIHELATKDRPLPHTRRLRGRSFPTSEGQGARAALSDVAVQVGTAGLSVRRVLERRNARREERIRTAHPKLGRLIDALTDDPESARGWDVGAVGEVRVGQCLYEFATDKLRVLLHDRRIPGSRVNIDHLAVNPPGVYVIDANK